jgi:hypothetical protein
METCRVCDARLHVSSSFCARCLTPIAPSEDDVAGGLVDVAAAGGRWRDPQPPGGSWKPEERLTAPAPPKTHSRWRSSELTFGPAGKIAISVVVLGLPLLAWKLLGMWAIEFTLLWTVIMVPRVMRDVWKRSRVR